MKVYLLEKRTPTRGFWPEHVGAFENKDKALDKRRTKLRHNVAWREVSKGVWTTQSPDYMYSLYPHYTVTEMEVQ